MGAVKSVTVTCPTCRGEGELVQLTGPGRDSKTGYGIEPDEHVTTCPACRGVGRVLDVDAEYRDHLDGLADDASLEQSFQDHLFITGEEQQLSAPQPQARVQVEPTNAHSG